MFVNYTESQKELRREFRAYFSNLIKPEHREELRNAESGGLYKSLIRQQGLDGMLAVAWPEQYGGRGLTQSEQLIRYEEALLAGAPTPFVTLNTVGPAIISKGTEEQKARFLPGIAGGELHFAIGYTEPSAGTDLAAVATTAVKQGDNYLVNGNKVFTSGAEGADYIWLAARTNPDVPKHKGISILVADTRDPGFSFGPIHTMGGVRTNVTYYSDVKVPVDMIIGEENGGWRLITEQLNHERVGLAAWGIRLGSQYQKCTGSSGDRRSRRAAQSGRGLRPFGSNAGNERTHVMAAGPAGNESGISLCHQGLFHREDAGNLSSIDGRGGAARTSGCR
jgi:alkylation response protein AidB-like acyl-CoA dehydrogenase